MNDTTKKRNGYPQDPHAAVRDATPRAEADPMRPRYHFHAPANWMNDPNGTVYHDGYYEVFYQSNPYGDNWDRMHWGHARTRDFLAWQHLPIALIPNPEFGETGCWSGVCLPRSARPPILLYTSARDRDAGEPFVQRIADGDESFLLWRPREAPLLQLDDVPFPIDGDWRDPFVFRHDGRYFLILAARPIDDTRPPAVLLFHASDETLENWEYHGVLFEWTQTDSLPECPNFIRLAEEWLLLVSPFAPVKFFRGAFDAESGRFTARESGLFDRSPQYYATNTITDAVGRTIVLAWIRGFPEGRGWNGCLALPRELSIGADGALERNPVREIEKLRGVQRVVDHTSFCCARSVSIADVSPAKMELTMRYTVPEGSAVRVEFLVGTRAVVAIECTDSEISVGDDVIPVDQANPITDASRSGPSHEIRLFTDQSVIELYLDRGRECLTRVVPGLHLCETAIVSRTNRAEIHRAEYYPMSDATYDFSLFPAYCTKTGG
ncbi:MAG: glycoside hydrolase family 32 protein [Spirochaetaceae bacterium]|nr:MAG: glycoside hydrolase family 32 protein [Spirochaetaceae bacterium]